MLNLDITLVFQLINFFIALFFLNWLLIRPIREIIRKRNDIMDGMASEADNFTNEARQRLANYEAELAKARKEGGAEREAQRNEALAELAAIVDKAQKSARDLLEENRKNIQGQAEQALSELRDGIDNFSTRLGNKLMGME